MNIQDTFNRIYNKIPPHARIASLATFISGMLCNFFIFTNKAVNHDDIIAEFSYNDSFDISCGRWMWLYIRKLATYYDMPAVKGIIAMLLLAMSVALIVTLLDIREPVLAAITGMIFATYPINACFFSYLAISEIYYFAIFFTAASVFMVERHRWIGPAAGILLLCLSLGTYQSMLCFFIALVFIMAFIELFSDTFNLRRWFFRYLRYAVTAVGGYALYYLITKLYLVRTGISLRQYAGTDKMFSFEPASLLISITDSYEFAYEYFLTKATIDHRLYVLFNWLLIAVILLVVICQCVKFLRSRHFASMAVLTAMTITFPVFLNFIYIIMNNKSAAHILMRYSYILLYAFALALVRLAEFSHINLKIRLAAQTAIQWAVFLACTVMVYYGVIVSNQLYQRLYYNTKSIDAMTTGLVTRISEMPGWTVDEPICFANFDTFLNGNYQSGTPFASELPPYMWIGTDLYPWYSTEHLLIYISYNQHLTLKAQNEDVHDSICATGEFRDMPVYPNSGSIKRINGIVTVKFGE